MKRFLILIYNDQGVIARTYDFRSAVEHRKEDAKELGLQVQVYELQLIDEEHPEAGLKYVFVEG